MKKRRVSFWDVYSKYFNETLKIFIRGEEMLDEKELNRIAIILKEFFLPALKASLKIEAEKIRKELFEDLDEKIREIQNQIDRGLFLKEAKTFKKILKSHYRNK